MPEARATREALGSLPRDFDEGFGKPQDGEIGPPDKMRPDVPRVRAKDYARFKKLMGAAKEDHEYHHIVEQREIDKSPELDPKDEGALNGSENIVELPKNIHKCINKKMLTKNPETGKSPRDDNEGKSLKEKFGQGIKIMKKCIAEEIAKLKPEDREKLRTPEKPKHPPEEEAPKKPDTLPEEEPIPLPPPRMTVPPIAPPSGGRTPGIIPSPGYKPGVGHPFFGRQWPPIAG
jgi:hypothetical protein